ncbi:MAG: hypothetical protein ABIJ50_03405 [Pseudomonadota bacterium]
MMTANDKATLSVQADHLDKVALRLQDQITTITTFFQERYGCQSLTITRLYLPMIPPALDAAPSIGFLWEVKHD